MKSFYQEWLRKNRDENIAAQESPTTTSTSTSAVNVQQPSSPIASTSRTIPSATMESSTVPVPAVSNNPENGPVQPSEIIFENDQFQFFLQRESFQRQKRFHLQDHLFHAKIKLKDESEAPFLKDILDFLEEGLLHLINNLKINYKEEDANVCFLTLFQQPMINALNSGIMLFLY
jgi:hypothetical protein